MHWRWSRRIRRRSLPRPRSIFGLGSVRRLLWSPSGFGHRLRLGLLYLLNYNLFRHGLCLCLRRLRLWLWLWLWLLIWLWLTIFLLDLRCLCHLLIVY